LALKGICKPSLADTEVLIVCADPHNVGRRDWVQGLRQVLAATAAQ